MVWPCKDGYVGFAVHGSRMAKNYTTPMVAWMESEGMAPDFLKEIDWEAFDINMVNKEELDRIQEPIGRFLLSRTKAELSEEAMKRRIILYPVSSSKDLLEDRQLGARDFWREVEHPELGAAITYPGPFTKASGPSCGIRRRPPLIGEHNLEILGDELGLSREELTTLKQAGAI
jgi:crotonobetainyl-CoA:carnitine CoA-transferase CaiB-like acyl-CoA transferase